MNSFSKALKLLTDYRTFRTLLSFRFNGYLRDLGWFESRKSGSSVNTAGEPIPWFTYPFLKFLEQRLPAGISLFEFGCGNSTLYFARRVRSIMSVEHDPGWFEHVRSQLPRNATIVFRELSIDGPYSRTAATSGNKYDMIVVDGRDRVHCIKNSLKALRSTGVIVLDDAERPDYRKGVEFLLKKGFKQLDFWGIPPGEMDQKSTALFYRDRNCLLV